MFKCEKSRKAICMMITALAAVFLCTAAVARDVKVMPGHTAKADSKEIACFAEPDGDGYAVLPPPPAFDSVHFMHDKAMYETGLSLRNTDRGGQAAVDAGRYYKLDSLFKAFGTDITPEKTPEIYALLHCVGKKISDHRVKNLYKRARPYVFYNAHTCLPDAENKLRNTSSYPSGHSMRGWSMALILSEINPARKEAILRHGYEYGQSRVICGYHWQSDVDAGRLMAAIAVSAFHSDPGFMKRLRKAKDEFAELVKNGKVRQQP